MTDANNAIKLLRPREAALQLAISERTLWTLTKAGTIPCIRLGRSVRYRPSDIEKQLNSLLSGNSK